MGAKFENMAQKAGAYWVCCHLTDEIPDSRTVGDTNYSEYKFIKTGFKLIDNIL